MYIGFPLRVVNRESAPKRDAARYGKRRESVGTWGSGVFQNDHSLDYVGDLTDRFMATVDEFLKSPFIDQGFDQALAAIALLNEVMTRTGSRPFDHAAGDSRDPAPIAEVFLECFDKQAAGLVGDVQYQQEWRNVVAAELDRFVGLLSAS